MILWKGGRIKKAFIKTFVLVIVFCILILFSIKFFNKDQRGLQEVPLVDNCFKIVINISDWIDENINQKIDLVKIFRAN